MSDSETQARQQLAHFLKDRRARISARDIGLPVSARRRAPGLLREEVAQLAGISVTWYTWMEQARPTNPSMVVLKRLARTLRLSATERAHLINLARPDLDPAAPAAKLALPAPLAEILRGLAPHPAYMVDPHWDVVAWNEPAARLFGDFGKIEPTARNILELLFLDLTWRALFADWAVVAEAAVGQYRASTVHLRDDQRLRTRIARLMERSAEFRRWWPRQEVAGPASWRKTINHPQAGTIVFNYAALRADDAQGGLQVVIYTPVADGMSPQRLMTLVAAKPRRAAPR
jgi:transcriptional regulator with XRE-family HTH domain